jgi:hypothetical protein
MDELPIQQVLYHCSAGSLERIVIKMNVQSAEVKALGAGMAAWGQF